MQICPDCHKEWPDDTNYCPDCGAKLPNAKDWMPDYNKISDSPEESMEEISKMIRASLDNASFREHLLLVIIKRAVEGFGSSSAEEKYMGKEILKMMFGEMMFR